MVHLRIGVGSWSGIQQSLIFTQIVLFIKLLTGCLNISVDGAIVQFYLHVLPGLVGVLGQCGW